MIQIEKLTVAYGRTIALDALDLELRPGITGLFGPNGSGKSTLLRAIAGLLRPTAGEIKLDGRHVFARDEAFRRRVGYSGHQTGLYERLSVRENLLLFARLYGATQSRVDGLIGSLGLEDRRDVPAGALSAGGKRSASVARALLHSPDVLLLDEPYANLDDDAAERISMAVQEWRQPHRVGVIATHGAKRVKGFADASLILQRAHAVSYRIRVPADPETEA
ncbi:MAG: heme exporter protein [Actinomycetota bacterium]|nr:heme exporter protein [Actinomycetota bacterium]